MGMKGNWFSGKKKTLSPESEEKKNRKSNKFKKKWFGKQKQFNSEGTSLDNAAVPSPPSLPVPQQEEVILTNATAEIEQLRPAYPVDVTPAAAVDDVTTTHFAPEVGRLSSVTQFAGKSREEIAAIKIQTAIRGYLARRVLRALRGLVRLKSLMEGPVAKRQAASTLRCMQTLSRVQSQIRSTRIRLSEENQALQKQLLQKHARELENLQIAEEWDDSIQSKEKIEANLLSKHEATRRRERALAYAFSHQQTWKNSSKSVNPMFTDPSNPSWGWSWLERWMASRPWESQSATDKELNNDQSSLRSAGFSISEGEISKAYARHQLNSHKFSPPDSQQSTGPPNLPGPSTPSKPTSTVPRKVKSASPKSNIQLPDDDSKSMNSMQLDRNRRHSISGSSVRDDESLTNSRAVPSYMVPTKSARAKSRLQSSSEAENNETPEKGSGASAKKRLSYPPSPARPRRHSGPPKVASSFNLESNSVINGVIG